MQIMLKSILTWWDFNVLGLKKNIKMNINADSFALIRKTMQIANINYLEHENHTPLCVRARSSPIRCNSSKNQFKQGATNISPLMRVVRAETKSWKRHQPTADVSNDDLFMIQLWASTAFCHKCSDISTTINCFLQSVW